MSRIELGKQELDSIADINALQGILGTEILDGTALSAGRETDDAKRLEETIEIVRELERIKAGLEDLSRATDKLLSFIGPVESRTRVGGFQPDDFVKTITDLWPGDDPDEIKKGLLQALVDATEERTSRGVDQET